MRLSELKNRKVVIWGTGREAGSVIRALKLRNIDAAVTVIDEKPGAMLDGIEAKPVDIDIIAAADVVVRSPGVSRYRSELTHAKAVTTATNLWFGEEHAPIIAITGTKGKSTTSSLIAHVMAALGMRVQLAGNIGQSPLDLLGEPEPEWWILELSSYQTSDMDGAVDIGVLTSLSPEHLDWHGGYERYVDDKLRLLAGAKLRIINTADPGVQAASDGLHPFIGPDTAIPPLPSKLLGQHNDQLTRLALTAIAETGIDLQQRQNEIAAALSTFDPLPHRLQPVFERNGITYVNDSLSTTPVATMAAIDAFGNRPVTVLVGGYDRGLSYEDFGEYVRAHDNVVLVTLPDSGHRISAAAGVPKRTIEAVDMRDAVIRARAVTPEGGVILLSPGAPSFGHFVDYAERGDAFARAARSLDN